MASDIGDIISGIIDAKSAAARDPWLEKIGKPYRPGSGTEGIAFDEIWCDHCARDAEYRKDDNAIGCRIIADTFAYDIKDPRYPKEWIYDRNGCPCCTALRLTPVSLSGATRRAICLRS